MAYESIGAGHCFNHEGGGDKAHEGEEDQQQSSQEEASQTERLRESQWTSTKDQIEHVDQRKLDLLSWVCAGVYHGIIKSLWYSYLILY